jgi:TolB-like protein
MPPGRRAEVSVAVLPLDDLSPGGDQGYFSDGMTDALISNLGSISALRVISRTSVMQYKDARRSVPEVARELGVTHVVDGSVLRAEGKVRITVQLIDAAVDRQLWSESYERELSEILVLQREVAAVVVDGIRVKLTGTPEAQLSGTTTVSPPAYEAYLRGHEALGRFQFVEGIDFFNAAIEEEPNFALAHTFLAHSYLVLGLGFTEESPKELVPRAQAAVRKALELDNTLAEAHRILGDIRLNYEWDWEGAESPIQHVIYVIKENRTYDQIFGEIKEGNGDPQRTVFGESIAPNHHKLAREFVLFDNFYVNGDVSADGQNWSVSGIANDFVEKLWPNPRLVCNRPPAPSPMLARSLRASVRVISSTRPRQGSHRSAGGPDAGVARFALSC